MVFLFSVFLIASLTSATFYNLDNTQEVELEVQNSIYVELSSNPTTGYSWVISNNNSEKLVFASLTGTYNQPAPGSPRGTPGKQVFQIACNEKCTVGDAEFVTFVYKRSWETLPGETRLIRVSIVSKP